MRNVFYLLSICACFLIVFYQDSKAQESYGGYEIENGSAWGDVFDCNLATQFPPVPVFSNEHILMNGCQVRNGNQGRYGYPNVVWRSFGAKDVDDDVFETQKDSYGTEGALADIDNFQSRIKLDSKIVYSGDTAAVDIFKNIADIGSSDVKNIGGITVDANNKEQVQIYTRAINRNSSPPFILALYDQYGGKLYLHAFKARRTTAKHVEILHARLSPLHLGFLDGKIEYDYFWNTMHDFYNPQYYLFDNLDFSGAFTAAGQMARFLGADTVIAYVPRIEMDFLQRADGTDAVAVNYQIQPRWFYGIPQEIDNTDASINGITIGFSNAICAAEGFSHGDTCAERNFIPSYLAILEVSDFFQSSNITLHNIMQANTNTVSEQWLRADIPDNINILAADEVFSFNDDLFGGNATFEGLLAALNDDNLKIGNLQILGPNIGASSFFRKDINGDHTTTVTDGLLDTDSQELLTWISEKIQVNINDGKILDSSLANASVLTLLIGACDYAKTKKDCGPGYAGIIPRADAFVPHVGGELVAPLLNE